MNFWNSPGKSSPNQKLRPRAKRPKISVDFFVQNRAPVQGVLKILKKIALPSGASSKIRRFFAQNRAPVRSILKILTQIALPCAESKISSCLHQKSLPVRSILNFLKNTAFPRGASLKFRRFFIQRIAFTCGASSKFGRYKANQG